VQHTSEDYDNIVLFTLKSYKKTSSNNMVLSFGFMHAVSCWCFPCNLVLFTTKRNVFGSADVFVCTIKIM